MYKGEGSKYRKILHTYFKDAPKDAEITVADVSPSSVFFSAEGEREGGMGGRDREREECSPSFLPSICRARSTKVLRGQFRALVSRGHYPESGPVSLSVDAIY